MALATSPKYVLQGVNTAFELFNTSGGVVFGPVDAKPFFGVPNLPNKCDPAGPFLSDPRAFYDQNTGFFWEAILQLENAAGIAPNCPFQSTYWIENFNPKTMSRCVYHFDMALGTTNVADYTQFGFSGSTVGWSGNMFNNPGTAYSYAEAMFAPKAAMQACAVVKPTAFTNLSVGGTLVDTVQPVQTETTPSEDPGVLYLVNSFNMNGDPFGHDCFLTACQGHVVWAFDPASKSLSGSFVSETIPNPTYVSPPNADQPGCSQCVETIDTRITGTPVYSVGGGSALISFSLDTAVQNGGIPPSPHIVPGILWGQIQVSLVPGFVFGSLYQSGYLAYSGDRAVSFGTMMQDKEGRLVMVFDTMSPSLNPSIMVTTQAPGAPLGSLTAPVFLIKGPSPTNNTRWGDYEAASYDGFTSNHIWVASEYSATGDWTTLIARK
jgi:hypothetical protein